MNRYGSVPELDFYTFCQLIQKAREEKKRSELYQAWLQLLPMMQKKEIKFVPFKEYYDRCTGANIDRRPAEEILAEVAEIRREMLEK